jgi:hypothetical protein
VKRLLLVFLLLGVSLFVGCGGSSGGSTPPPTVTLVSIQVTPAAPSIAPGSTQQFKATGTYSDGTTKDLTTSANWLSATQSVATINVSGLATGVAAGTSSISATSGTIVGTTTLTVINPLVSIAVTPATSSIAPGATQQFIATGTYADHSTQIITSSVTWSASVGATITTGGLATGVTPNTTSTIMAAQGTISGTAVLTITNPLVSIAVTPLTASIAATFTQQFTATGTYADGSTNVITSTVTWASTAPAIATISNSQGTQGLATGVAAGTTSITATLGSVTSPPAALTVTTATLVSIAVTPATPAIILQTQQQFTATGTFSDNTTLNITNTVTWSSSNTSKISITVSGLATGVGTTSSPVTIQASKSGVNGSTTATVIPPPVLSIAITPNTTTLAMGTSQRYKATATLANGGTLNVTSLATWASTNTAIATVNTGLVNAKTVTQPHNPVTISATYNGVIGSITLDVTNATVTSITVTPIAATIPAGAQQQFFATATFSDSSTQDVSGNATWNSNNTSVATVSVVGVAFGVSSSPTPVTISAAFGGQTGTAQLTVSSATLVSIAVTPTSLLLAPGSTANFQAVGTYSDLSTQLLTGLVTWASTNSSVVSIVAGGIATGQSAGPANITASYQGVTSNASQVVVTSSPLASIAVTPSPATVPEGVALRFTATGTFVDQSTQNLTTNVTWASSQPSVANIGNAVGQQGLATGVAPGQTSITAVFASVVSAPAATLTVTNVVLQSIAITPSNPTITHGSNRQLTAIGTFSDNSTINLTTQATWTSSNATIATVNNGGLVSAVSPGTTTITSTFIQVTQSGPVLVTGTTVVTVN